jgi:hypothetical protein
MLITVLLRCISQQQQQLHELQGPAMAKAGWCNELYLPSQEIQSVPSLPQ